MTVKPDEQFRLLSSGLSFPRTRLELCCPQRHGFFRPPLPRASRPTQVHPVACLRPGNVLRADPTALSAGSEGRGAPASQGPCPIFPQELGHPRTPGFRSRDRTRLLPLAECLPDPHAESLPGRREDEGRSLAGNNPGRARARSRAGESARLARPRPIARCGAVCAR